MRIEEAGYTTRPARPGIQPDMQMDDRRLARIRSEYLEMPGLKLTAAQASRFWNLGPEESRIALESLVEAGVLWRTRDGHYVLMADSAAV
jgi:hypothetical protein